jgi:hypothetical protein
MSSTKIEAAAMPADWSHDGSGGFENKKRTVWCAIDAEGDLEIARITRAPFGGSLTDTIYIPRGVLRALLADEREQVRQEAELAGKLAALREVALLACTKKWADLTGSKEAAWGRAYKEAIDELLVKYNPKGGT